MSVGQLKSALIRTRHGLDALQVENKELRVDVEELQAELDKVCECPAGRRFCPICGGTLPDQGGTPS